MEETIESGGLDEAEFRRRLPLYERLVEEVKYVLETKLADSGIPVASLNGRAKSIDSFRAKIARKRYSAPLGKV